MCVCVRRERSPPPPRSDHGHRMALMALSDLRCNNLSNVRVYCRCFLYGVVVVGCGVVGYVYVCAQSVCERRHEPCLV